MEEHPLYAMMEVAAIAARAAAPGPVFPVPAPGNPVDDAVAVLADTDEQGNCGDVARAGTRGQESRRHDP